jgi:hypothetical protein
MQTPSIVTHTRDNIIIVNVIINFIITVVKHILLFDVISLILYEFDRLVP